MVNAHNETTLNSEDVYVISCFKSLSFVDVISLCELYQPLTSSESIALFLTLYAEGYQQNNAYMHSRLLSLLNMSVHQFVHARSLLEQYGLIETFVKHEVQNNKYIYVLKHPKGTEQFLDDSFYARALASTIGTDEYALTLSKYKKESFDFSTYQNITTPLNGNAMNKKWNEERERVFNDLNTAPSSNSYDSSIFDIDSFLASCTDFQFPYKLRNKQVLDTIYNYAKLYHLDEKTMALGLFKAIRNDQFDAKVLLNYCLKNVTVSKTINLEQDNSAAVLQHYKQGVKLTNSEAKLLNRLASEYKFSNAIINQIIEYCITQYHQFNQIQVIPCANTLVYAKVSNSSQVQSILSKMQNQLGFKKNTYVENVPTYLKGQSQANALDESYESNYEAFFKEDE